MRCDASLPIHTPHTDPRVHEAGHVTNEHHCVYGQDTSAPHPQPLALTTLRDLMVYGLPNPDPQEPPPPRAEPSLTTQISPNVRPLQAVQSNTGPYAQSSTHGWYSGVLQWESMGDL